MDRFISMQMFVRTVDKGSLTAAAEGIGMTSTMVGNHIRELESRLGARLITRTTRSQTLTEVGKSYYEKCVEILASVQDAESLAQAMTQSPRGLVRVSSPISFGVQCLTPALHTFLRECPEVEVELSLSDRIVDVARDEFDAAVRIGPLPDSGLVARPLATWVRVLCASPDYLAARGEPKSVQELVEHECLSFTYSSGRERDWKFPRSDGTFDVVRVSGRLSIDNGPALRAAARAGLGIIMQPERLVLDDIVSGRLVRVLENQATVTSPMNVVYLSDRQLTPKLATFLDFMAGTFR
jgi:DNA-binding transcriptional LysR family regulator